MSDSIYQQSGIVRTDVYCHACDRNFIAHIDYDVDGKHVVECPYCGHHHFRQIQQGIVSKQRHDSDPSLAHRDRAERGMWKHHSMPIATATVSHFLRDRWLNRSDQ